MIINISNKQNSKKLNQFFETLFIFFIFKQCVFQIKKNKIKNILIKIFLILFLQIKQIKKLLVINLLIKCSYIFHILFFG